MRRRRPLVSLTFDDGTRDHIDVARLIASHGLRATFYVNSGLVSTSPEHLTWDDVGEIASLGHEIGGHTSTHPDLATLDRETAAAQVEGDKAQLAARGVAAVTFAYPYGSQNREVQEIVAQAGYTCGRRAWGLAASADDRERPGVEANPPPDPYALRTYPSIENDATLDDLQRIVRRAETDRGWIPLVFHKITEGTWTYELSAAIFEPFVNWLASQQDRIAVETIASALRR